MASTVRPAFPLDLPQIQSIYAHYVSNTVVPFLHQAPPLDYVKTRYETSMSRKLPYLVAVQDGSDKVLGYAYASPFRGFMLGYGHTVEITIFCDSGQKKKGIGSLLMEQLLLQLRATKHVSTETGYEETPVEFDVWNVLAVMSVDDESEDGMKGMGLRDWYGKWGFQEVGRLKGVGSKFGRRLDTLYMELQLQ